MTIRILLVDDHTVVRQGLHSLLSTESDFEIIGEASNGTEAIQKVFQLKPDVLVVDLMMPGVNGLEVTRQVSQVTHVVVLSMHANEAYVLEALRFGAYAYVLKEATSSELALAIRNAMEGKRYLSAPLNERAIQTYTEKTTPTTLDAFDTLTSREREIFLMVAEGLSAPEISKKLSISPRTVEIHRANIFRKLNIHNQSELIRLAIRKGLLPLDE
jgi:DNA-binding NarL/FixJ family response regulator